MEWKFHTMEIGPAVISMPWKFAEWEVFASIDIMGSILRSFSGRVFCATRRQGLPLTSCAKC